MGEFFEMVGWTVLAVACVAVSIYVLFYHGTKYSRKQRELARMKKRDYEALVKDRAEVIEQYKRGEITREEATKRIEIIDKFLRLHDFD